MKLFSITSDLHSEVACKAGSEKFIRDIVAACGCEFDERTDFGDYDSRDSTLYVRTGGTEGIFKAIFCKDGRPAIPGNAPVRLLTSGRSNSLAASMEILSFLRQNGLEGEILHGSAEDIAGALAKPATGASSGLIRELGAPMSLEGKRYGVIGKPSDWLISSTVDYAKAKAVLGCEIIDIPIEELVSDILKVGYDAPSNLKPFNAPKFGKRVGEPDFRRAIDIYGALKAMCVKYSLDGFTLRCFDLLTTVSNTGCLALAALNSEGYAATCEGDVPAMLSMAVGRHLTGKSGFQVNLSRAEADRLLFAHCTVPFDMVTDYCYDTHFESGIGIGIHGEFEEGVPATLFKIGSDLEHFIQADITLLKNQYENNLCRTQVWVEAPGLRYYMLREPLGNHHVILPR